MDNHVHFILEPTNYKGLALTFKSVNVKYSHYYNKKRNRKGRLWEGRYFSSLLDDQYLYEAIRYVELNPYRANMELEIGQYYWNSCKERLKLRSDYYLHKLPKSIDIPNWKNYLEEGILNVSFSQKINQFTFAGKPLGNEEFINELSSKTGRDLTLKKQGRPCKI